MKKSYSTRLKSRGFALVVTLSLMILLTLVAVGLLSLTTVSMRTGSQTKAEAEARANAKLALMFALGELQKQMGPDQRVSASGDITDPDTLKIKHPHWIGVWNSWKAGAGEASQHSTIGSQPDSAIHPTYQARREDYFRSWLLSLNPGEAQSVTSPMSVSITGSSMPESGATAVELVGKGSLGNNGNPKDYVSARLLSVKAPTGTNPAGRYGWWVGDESQKARIMDDSYKSTPAQTLAEKIFRSQAPGAAGTTTVKGLEQIDEDKQDVQRQLAGLPSLESLDLIKGATGKPAENFHSVTPFSYGVLSDVREGGLKRDLSTLLERPISRSETQDAFMLYRFDTQGQERVPIQDIAAYYQLYDSSRDPAKAIRYSSQPQNNQLPNGIQVAAPDYGDNNAANADKYLREYTSLYRSPVPIKLQLVAGMRAQPLATPTVNGSTHRIELGFLPAVTLWNPNNVPITMNIGNPDVMSQMLRLTNLPFAIEWRLNGGAYVSKPVTMGYATSVWANNSSTGRSDNGGKNDTIFDMYFSAKENPIVFAPGEVRLFSFRGSPTGAATLFGMRQDGSQRFVDTQEAKPGWDSSMGFYVGRNSSWQVQNQQSSDGHFVKVGSNGFLAFKASDTISFTIRTEKEYSNQVQAALNQGSAMSFSMVQKAHAISGSNTKWGWNNYEFRCRTGSATATRDFNDSLIRKGFPQSFQISVTGADLIAMRNQPLPADQWKAFFQFALMAGCETNEASNGTPFAGRKFASRPYLHSSPIKPPYVDSEESASLYNHGWNWWIQGIGSILEAYVENDIGNPGRGLYGGGYNLRNGTGHVVQQEIPVTPPISIAALSHAHLGGFSLSDENPVAPPSGSVNYERVTAVGYGGLFPHTVQAIGNSYAQPNLAPDKAFRNDWTRTLAASSPKTVTFADHSYLANKALWDEYFFSSITPQKQEVKIFDGNNRPDAKAVARDFFFNETPLPNRRIVAYKNDFDSSKLDTLFATSEAAKFTGGLADKIAAHLMVEGSFNINSTSEEAWKVFLSSLKGKGVAYLDKSRALTDGVKLTEATVSGTPVANASMPNGKAFSGSSDRPASAGQWTDWRELTDNEVGELATAIVKQVKLRGPFLSLSEFVNRRLDSSNKALATKGALQTALDDEKVSINGGFRASARKFSSAEAGSMGATAFPEALDGPVAYGSAAYIDQADILRNFAEQLAPRGDTFVVRTYGDAMDSSGKVQARAWCEAVVQRVPEYIDSKDEPFLKHADLTSEANKTFGRKFRIVSFRWLNSAEV